jgi:beta-lactamase regulating signal transducer with metallopeptidase domain/uncharacterized membrane protein
MSELFVLRALLFAGESFAASVLLLGSAAIATHFLKSASLRHLVWLTAFGTLLVLPVAALIVPPQVAIHRPVEAERATPEPASLSSLPAIPLLPPAPAPSWNVGTKDVALALFALWLIGFGWSVLRLLIGAIGINALHMSSKRIKDRQALADLDGCELRIADDQSGPMTWGAVRPVILLPDGALGWPPERLRAVLLHEMAHVRRLDSLAQTLSRIACAFYWANPLAWAGARALRREAEIAADDAVIGAGVRPSLYASELLRLATAYRGAQAVADAGLSMASKSALEARVKSILGGNTLRKGVTQMDIVKIAGAGLLATAAFGFVRPSLAADAPPVPPAPPSVATLAVMPTAPITPAVLAENDLPPPPPIADAPPTPPTPPAATVPPTPPADTHYEIDMHGDLGQTMHEMHAAMRHMTPEERRKLHEVLHNLHHQIHDAMAKASPEMRRALAEVKANREELKALRPQIEQAMREARPQIERAIEEASKAAADAKIDDRVRRHIERAMRHVEIHMDEHRAMHEHDMHEMGEEGPGANEHNDEDGNN